MGSEDETVAQGSSSQEWTSPSLERPRHLAEEHLTEPGVDLGPTLAQGGMSAVRLGQQRNLGRPVAVKTVKHGDLDETTALLREARLVSRLEHPNILPVHEIFVDGDGTPQIVFKLIEGETWSSLMRDPQKVGEDYGADDLLEWNLGVLGHVCRAVEFAHSRGVVHCDIKPANIMVGKFGEVYLLDWGIAQELEEASTGVGALPEGQIAGTSSYMAPEQFEGRASALGPWTDVYLLGATLFHALAGTPPHAGKSREQRYCDLAEGTEPTPALPDEVPGELRAIVDRAMHPDPEARFPSADAFRRALTRFSTHRVANRLVARGDEARALAESALARGDEPETLRHLDAAEMAYNAARGEWEGCPGALGGLAALTTLRVERALAADEPRLALKLLDAHGIAGPLRERAERALETASVEDARLRRLAADSDTTIGHRVRGVAGILALVAFTAAWSYWAFVPPETAAPLAWFTGGVLALGSLALGPALPRLMRTRLNRTVFVVSIALMVLTVGICVGGAAIGLTVRQIQISMLALWSLASASIAASVHPLGLVTPVGFAVAFGVACVDPDLTGWATLGGGLVALGSQLHLNLFVTGRRHAARAAD